MSAFQEPIQTLRGPQHRRLRWRRGLPAGALFLHLLMLVSTSPGEALYIRYGRLWPTDLETGITTIRVCFDPEANGHSDSRRFTQTAIETSWEAVTPIEFVGWEECTEQDLESDSIIIVRFSSNANSPHSNCTGKCPSGANIIDLKSDFNKHWQDDCDDENYDECTKMYAVHEFGHALGFYHEQDRPDTPNSCDAKGDPENDAEMFNEWDDKSVMNYCASPRLGDGYLSDSDTLGVQSYYGGGASLAKEYFVGNVNAAASDSSDLIIVADQQSEIFIYSFVLEDDAGFAASSGTTTGDAYPDEAVTWLEGNFTGNDRSDLIAIVDGNNAGSLELTLFIADADGFTSSFSDSLEIAHGTETIQWLVGDFSGDGIADFVHLFSLGVSTFGQTTYQLDGYEIDQLGDQLFELDTRGDPRAVSGSYSTTEGLDFCLLQTAPSSNLQFTVFDGQGDGTFLQGDVVPVDLTGQSNVVAVAGDFTGDGTTDLAQPYNSNGVATLAILTPSDPENPLFAKDWLTGTQYSQTTTWFAGNVAEGSELSGLLQIVNSSGRLELVTYAATGIANNAFAQASDVTFEDVGYLAFAWLPGVVGGEELLGLFQVTANDSVMEVNTYQINTESGEYELYDQSPIVLFDRRN